MPAHNSHMTMGPNPVKHPARHHESGCKILFDHGKKGKSSVLTHPHIYKFGLELGVYSSLVKFVPQKVSLYPPDEGLLGVQSGTRTKRRLAGGLTPTLKRM